MTCKVYGINGNAQALENIQNGFMTATAWQDSFTEGYNMVEHHRRDRSRPATAGSRRPSKCRRCVVTKDTVEQFLKDHPDAIGQ